eukprot:332647-Rhodomonas_salina.1
MLCYAGYRQVNELRGLRAQQGYLPACVEESEPARARLVEHHSRGGGCARWGARGSEVRGVLGGWISPWVPRAYQNLEKMAEMFVGA